MSDLKIIRKKVQNQVIPSFSKPFGVIIILEIIKGGSTFFVMILFDIFKI